MDNQKRRFFENKDAAVLSNQSLCWARLNEGGLALEIAQLCSLIWPEWPKAYCRQGAALMLLKETLLGDKK
ncbi:hypothetical protein SLEP1_g937 [Rubroshorea leprosula]|uniref:Uncharacterized protein n=1 Tax=Rubroshorea leprosula TaxID=152421 RepID=A0AAV5HLL9_9ROSI|nr:hypothetical protein SLEP1_g937 [Rubroshorea leprosula]